MASRDEARRRTTAAILSAARTAIAEHGAAGLSMRAIARDVGMVSSAVYRYFPTRDALLTTMIVESYGNLAGALAAKSQEAADWRTLGRAWRDWARSVPHEFQLIYGTPIPGYRAPPETIPAAAAVVAPFLAVAGGSTPSAFRAPVLMGQFQALADDLPGANPAGVAAVVTELAALVGFVGLELAGHFVGVADPGDTLYEALLERQVESLGLA
jgi:AcrR family transcriptional regulator